MYSARAECGNGLIWLSLVHYKFVREWYCFNPVWLFHFWIWSWGYKAYTILKRSPRTTACHSLDYTALLRHFRICALSSRRVQHDILFIRNVFRCRIDSAFLLRSFTLSAPVRIGRQLSLFHVPYARVCTVRDGLFTRAPRLTNEYLRASPTSDLFHDHDSFSVFRTGVIGYVTNLWVSSYPHDFTCYCVPM